MRRKALILIALITVLFSASIIKTDALTIKRYSDSGSEEDEVVNIVDGPQVENTCSGIFTEDALKIISELLDYFRILTPAVLIVMIGADVTSIVMSSEHMPGGKDDSVRKATSRIVRRLIAAVMLFLIPTFVKVALNLDGVKDVIKLDDNCVNVIQRQY